MKYLFKSIIISFLLMNCGSQNQLSFKITTNSSEFNPNDTLKIQIISTKLEKIPEKIIYIDGNEVKPPYTLSYLKLGKHEIKAELVLKGDKIFLNKESVFEISPILPEGLAPQTLKYLKIA